MIRKALASVVVVGALVTVSGGPVEASSLTPAQAARTNVVAAARIAPIPTPDERLLCGIPLVRSRIPACSHGRWEPKQVKMLRCIAGTAGLARPNLWGAGMFLYRVIKCLNKDWQKW